MRGSRGLVRVRVRVRVRVLVRVRVYTPHLTSYTLLPTSDFPLPTCDAA